MITNDDMDNVFHALSHSARRAMLDELRKEPGMVVGKLAMRFDVSRIAVMNHLAVLEKAGLVLSEKRGRSRHLYLNVMPIREIYERWTDAYSDYWSGRMSFIKSAAEAAAQSSKEESER